jgi:hypothetical protein
MIPASLEPREGWPQFPLALVLAVVSRSEAAKYEDPPASYTVERAGVTYHGARVIDRLELDWNLFLLEFEWSCSECDARVPSDPAAVIANSFTRRLMKGPR